jgi:Reverse transcriptase (RNA-dependent DNA polymerase)
LLQDQFAFRPTGSTTAAVIFLLQKVTDILEKWPYVHVIALDFSKAFDSLSHVSLTKKLATTALPDYVYNWMISYLQGRGHRTRYGSEVSNEDMINASVVQGSALGPVSFIINAMDLHPKHKDNIMAKYADDCYLIIPSCNANTIQSELMSVTDWAMDNNLKLNHLKTQELVICKKNTIKSLLPVPVSGINRVSSLCILGVTINRYLELTEHIENVLSRGNQCLFALKTLRDKGLQGKSLSTVCRATFITSLTYASPAWWGFTTAHDQSRLQAMLNKAIRWKLDGECSLPDLTDICAKADLSLFQNVLKDPNHVLSQLLPAIKQQTYNLRARPHNRDVPMYSTLTGKNFLSRMLRIGLY